MKKAIREFMGWVKAHPYKACLFAALTAALGAWDGTRPYLDWIDLFPWALLLAAVALVIHWDGKGLSYLLIGALLCQPCGSRAQGVPVAASPRQPEGAGVIVGIVVVVVGGIIIFQVVRFCQRAFPRPPANGGTNSSFIAIGNYAAATSCSAIGGCYTASTNSALAAPEPVTVVELSGTMVEKDSGGLAFRLEGLKPKDSQTDAVDLFGFEQGLRAWGISFGGINEISYGLNGQPSTADQVPINFTLNGANSAVDASLGEGNGAMDTVLFERSSDLQHWEPILTMTVTAWQRVSFRDATSGPQMFYRGRPVGD